MKILLVNKFLYPRGGAESYMLKVGEYLTGLGHAVEYFGMYDEKNTVGNRVGAYTKNLDFHGSSLERFTYPFKIIYSLEAKRKISRVLEDFKPDVVHMNNINFQLTPSIIDAVKKRNIKLVQTVHDYQMACPNHLLYDFKKNQVCEKCVGKSKWNCVSGSCIHGSKIKSIIGAMEARFYKIKGTYKKVDTFICPSNFLATRLIREDAKTFQNRIKVICNFIEKGSLPETLKSNYPFPYVAFAGRLSNEKGIGILAGAAKQLPDVHFVVMGSGPEEHQLKNIPNVTLAGFVTGETLATNIACADAILVPSVCFENCPLSILEGQVLGVPSVTMNMGGMAELVEDGVTGYLSKSARSEDFAEAIQRMLSDREKLAVLKENCIRKSKSALTIEAYCSQLLEIYNT